MCPYCFSKNIYFSKKYNKLCCEDCGEKFDDKQEIIPQRVFISYGHDKNREIVNIIKDRLKERGHNPWIDSVEIAPGNDWRRKIESGICESNKFLAFISKHSVRVPGVCLDEIAIALGIRQCNIQSILLEKEVMAPNSISSIQWLDFSDWEEKKNIGGRIWDNWIENKLNSLYEIIENPENIKRSGELIELKRVLKPVLSDEKIRFLLDNNIVHRKWLLEKLYSLMGGNERIFCMIGGPGAGKSIYCALMSNYMNNVGATYFIDWQNKDSQKMESLISSLAFQLACDLPDYRYELIRILPFISIETCTAETLCDQLLVEPLNRLIDGGREKKLIIIDALDELKVDVQIAFLSLLEGLIEKTPRWVNWLFTSRQNQEVVRRFEQYCVIELDYYKNNIVDDLEEYINKYINDQQLKLMLIQKCEGSFFYVKELIDAINNNAITKTEMKDIPLRMANIYEKNFNRLIGEHYDKNKKSILSLVMFSFENISIREISDLIAIDYNEIKCFLVTLEAYVRLIKKDSEEFVYVVHKSLLDWITSDERSRFYLDERAAHDLIGNAFIRRINDNNTISKYLCFYGYEHLVNAKRWVLLSFYAKKKILEKCIEMCKEYGALYFEKKYIDIYCLDNYDKVSGYLYLLDYSIRANEEINTAIIDDLLEMSNKEKNEKSQYLIMEKIAVALFYLGRDEEAYNILMNEKEQKDKMFYENKDVSATWNHAMSLVTHDMDRNEDTVVSAIASAELYFSQDKTYEYLISLVNLFDAYMGKGDLNNAHFYAEKVRKISEEKYYIHVIDIYQICFANLLQTEGRIMEALAWYEKGLHLAQNIQSWDYIYGSIWRELAVAKFCDSSCLGRLDDMIKESKIQKFDYLLSLASCFYILASFQLGIYEPHKIKECYRQVISTNLPGHCLQVEIAIQLMKNKSLINGDFNDKWKANELVKSYIARCQGVKGMPEIIHEYVDGNNIELSEVETKWYKNYIVPVVLHKEEYTNELFQRRASEEFPNLQRMKCLDCEAKCCYDGVYLRTNEEADRIKELIEKFPEDFTIIPEDYIIKGTWPGMEDMKKTNVKVHQYKCSDYPKHFNETTCVFTMDNGECLLQRIATDHGLHPWFAKPTACWLFPIRGFSQNDGEIIPPLDIGEKDPDYVDESYPGYASFLPCGKAKKSIDDGDNNYMSWREIFKNEIEYYDYLVNNELIPPFSTTNSN